MTVFMVQFAPPPVLLILGDACSGSSFSRIWIKQAPALVDLKLVIIIKQTYRFLVWYSILHNCINSCNGMQATHKTSSMFCCSVIRIESHCRHRSTEFLTTQSGQSKRDVLIHYLLIYVYSVFLYCSYLQSNRITYILKGTFTNLTTLTTL